MEQEDEMKKWGYTRKPKHARLVPALKQKASRVTAQGSSLLVVILALWSMQASSGAITVLRNGDAMNMYIHQHCKPHVIPGDYLVSHHLIKMGAPADHFSKGWTWKH